MSYVKVRNLRKTGFRQHSTGLWIMGGEEKHLLHDGWLNNHVNALLLEII